MSIRLNDRTAKVIEAQCSGSTEASGGTCAELRGSLADRSRVALEGFPVGGAWLSELCEVRVAKPN